MMNRTVFAGFFTALLAGALVWLSTLMHLPFWYCLLCSALFFTAPQSSLSGLVTTLFTALLGILFGMIYVQIIPHIPSFTYRVEIFVAILVFALFIATQTRFLRYFACTLITFSLLIMQNGNWTITTLAAIVGIFFGFLASGLNSIITGKNLY